jgi:hypothetical protein
LLPIIQIVQGSTVVAEDRGMALVGWYNADFPPGEIWLDRRVLHITDAAQPGKAILRVVIQDHVIPLGELEVVGFDWITQRPLVENPLEAVFGKGIKLLGYKLYSFPNMNSTLPVYLTLYWQALADGSPEANYKVTTQILAADGHLVGQHDGIPVGGNRPFSGWVAGEYVIDEHQMTFNQPYTGPITIQVALYDPVTFERVLTDTGANAIVLPIHLEVESIP